MLQAGKEEDTDKLIMYLSKRLYGRLTPAQIGISKLFPENPLMLSLTLSFGSASARRLFFNALPSVIAQCASCQLHITNIRPLVFSKIILASKNSDHTI